MAPGRGSLGGEDAGRGGPVRPGDADATRRRVARRAAHDRRPLLRVAGQDVQQCRNAREQPSSTCESICAQAMVEHRPQSLHAVTVRWCVLRAPAMATARAPACRRPNPRRFRCGLRAHEEPHPSGVPFTARHHSHGPRTGPSIKLARRSQPRMRSRVVLAEPSLSSRWRDGDCADNDGQPRLDRGAQSRRARRARVLTWGMCF